MQKDLKKVCQERGISMTELAGKLGRSKQYISAVSTGKTRLSYELAVEIANVFESTPDYIFLCETSNEDKEKD